MEGLRKTNKHPRNGRLVSVLVHRVLVGKPEGKKPLERPRRRWEDGLKWTLGRLAGVCGMDSLSSG
jgi:hypothetical protein